MLVIFKYLIDSYRILIGLTQAVEYFYSCKVIPTERLVLSFFCYKLRAKIFHFESMFSLIIKSRDGVSFWHFNLR